MRPTVAVLAGSLVVLTIATGCSENGESGQALPVTTPSLESSSTPPSSSGDALPSYGAPKVEVPLDTAQFAKAPCDSLTPEQVTELMGDGVQGEPDPDAPPGPACNWHNQAFASIGIIYSNLGDEGLSSLYSQKGSLELFEPMPPIQGYPVVAYSQINDRQDGTCQVQIGTSDNSTMDVGITQSDKNVGTSDPCEAAHRVATMVINNIMAAR